MIITHRMETGKLVVELALLEIMWPVRKIIPFIHVSYANGHFQAILLIFIANESCCKLVIRFTDSKNALIGNCSVLMRYHSSFLKIPVLHVTLILFANV